MTKLGFSKTTEYLRQGGQLCGLLLSSSLCKHSWMDWDHALAGESWYPPNIENSHFLHGFDAAFARLLCLPVLIALLAWQHVHIHCTASELVRHSSWRADGRSPVKQGADNGNAGHRVHTGEVGHYHSQRRRTYLHAARQTHDLRELALQLLW